MKHRIATGDLRIIAGKWRSRKLSFPAVKQLRPTANRVRETLFNWLREEIQYADCLDLFAGSGACGLEALSRGAGHVTFVEQDRLVADSIAANLALLGEPDMPVICSDAIVWLKHGKQTASNCFEVVFIDPPYVEQLEREVCHALESSNLLKERALIYLESDRDLPDDLFPTNWQLLKKKRAAAVFFMLLERLGEGINESDG